MRDNSGHRQRLKERFLKDNGDAMPDYELLELLLSFAIPRRDVKPLAKELLREFGSFAQIIHADYTQLSCINGLGEHSAILLKSVQSAQLRALRQEIYDKPLMAGLTDVIDYLKSAMRYEQCEILRVLYLNQQQYMICDDLLQRGTIDHAPLYPRQIVKRALDIGATSLIIAHNHPSGDATPSADDITITQNLKNILHGLDMQLHDHVIIGINAIYSFRAEGLI